MKISGLQKLTLLDYPGKMAAIIFIAGCNFLCPFCHNSDLVVAPKDAPEISQEEIFSFLNKRKGILDGIVISGGEPLLYEETIDLIKRIKDLGYSVKLDTNGSFPERLKEVIDKGLVDYVAMDIKNCKEKYAKTIGKESFDISKIERSVEILKNGKVPYEFRTTIVRELHTPQDIVDIGKWINGTKNYFLQPYRDSESVIMKGFSAPKKDELEAIKAEIKPFAENVEIRGID